MSATTGTTYRWKTSDLDRLPDEPLLRYEIVDGELIVTKRPEWTHQKVIRKLLVVLDAPLSSLGGEVLPEPGIVWSEEAEDNVVPDIAVILPDRLHLLVGPKLSGAPNIVIEVVSPGSVETDYVKKRGLYHRAGVQEYWIVDSDKRTVEVWRFAGNKANSELYQSGGIIQTTLVPGLAVQVSGLW
ncbi:MAG: Uma2 family endonuclease [Acidobacteria bacterium]|nr:Uma2 family endonuclease [Acidobacteriota bacterium]